jgi:predicted enzyme related to lactoylglutathione lyase
MTAPIVFFDIAGPDFTSQKAFYEAVFDWKVGPGGMLSVPVSGPMLNGVLRTDPSERMIYLGVPDVKATLEKVEEQGGKVVAPRFEVKGVVVLGLFTDPCGNRMGVVEMNGDKPVIP